MSQASFKCVVCDLPFKSCCGFRQHARHCDAKQIPEITFDNTEESEPRVSQHQTGVKDKETHENKVTKY